MPTAAQAPIARTGSVRTTTASSSSLASSSSEAPSATRLPADQPNGKAAPDHAGQPFGLEVGGELFDECAQPPFVRGVGTRRAPSGTLVAVHHTGDSSAARLAWCRCRCGFVRGIGWRGRIRTFGLLIQSQAPYRLATRQRKRWDDTAAPTAERGHARFTPARAVCRPSVHEVHGLGPGPAVTFSTPASACHAARSRASRCRTRRAGQESRPGACAQRRAAEQAGVGPARDRFEMDAQDDVVVAPLVAWGCQPP